MSSFSHVPLRNNRTNPKKVSSPQPASNVKLQSDAQSLNNDLKQDIHADQFTSDNVMMLQRTIGNHATGKLVTGKHIQRIMSYEDFQKQTGQTAKAKKTLGGRLGMGRSAFNEDMANMGTQNQVDIFSGKVGAEIMETTRGANKIERAVPAISDTALLEMSSNINTAFQSYEKSIGKPHELKELIRLFDTITIWQAGNAGNSYVAAADVTLEPLKKQIQAEVQNHTNKLGGAPDTLQGRGTLANFQFPALDQFLGEIGVAPKFYLDYLAPNQGLLLDLRRAYVHLKAGRTEQAGPLIDHLNQQIPGFYMVRSLLIAKFPALAGLEELIGTPAEQDTSSKMTPEESAAINWYTSEAYKTINTQLRNQPLLPSDAGRRRGIQNYGGARHQATEQVKQRTQSQMELAVSGMNKLPRFSGICYRNIAAPGKEFLNAVSPGGSTADIGFASASPSMKGVGDFMTTQKGSKHIFFMIHTKTAVNVVAVSKSPQEGEILFRPGVKFTIKAVWQHNGQGTVPRNAPVEAQMVLHAHMPFKDDTGKSKSHEDIAKNGKLDDKDDSKYMGDYHQTKVIELVEV